MSEEITPTEVSENSEIESVSAEEEATQLANAIDGESTEDKPVEESEEKEVSEEKKEEVKQELKKILKLKVDGQEIEDVVDLNDEEGLTKKLQLAHAAQKRMQEAAEFKKQVNEFFSLLQNDPTSALQELGLDVDDIAKSHLEKIVEEAEMSPEEKQKREMEAELEKLRKESQEKEERARKIEMERLKDRYAADIENDITNAIETLPDLPKSPYVIKRMADAMMLAMNNGYNDVKAKDVLPVVHKQIKSEIEQMFGVMPEEVLEQFIGKKNIDRLRKRRLKRAKKGKTETASQIKRTGEKSEPKPAKKQTMSEFFKNLG